MRAKSLDRLSIFAKGSNVPTIKITPASESDLLIKSNEEGKKDRNKNLDNDSPEIESLKEIVPLTKRRSLLDTYMEIVGNESQCLSK